MKVNPNTHLAAEFYVLSSLNRLGIEAHLTLGNHKAVDILVKKTNGKLITIDVKGVQDGGWRIGKKGFLEHKSHYYVFVNYKKKIENPACSPETYIILSTKLKKFSSYTSKSEYGINYKKLREGGMQYMNNWKPLI